MGFWSWSTSDQHFRWLLVFSIWIRSTINRWGELQSDSSLTIKGSLNLISVFDLWVGSFGAIGALMSCMNRSILETVGLAMDHFSCT